MSMEAVLNRFVENRALAVMSRVILEEILSEDLDAVFDEHRQRQYQRELLFSQLTITMADVVLGTEPSPHQAYKSHRKDLRVSSASFYEKLRNIETGISEAMVRHCYEKSCVMQDELGFVPRNTIRGYRCRVIDGNHIQKTEKRLTELRGIASAALPGTVVATYELGRNLFDRAYLLEDAHAQEASVLDRVLEDVKKNDLIIGDRHFCIISFMAGIIAKKGAFIIRQHGRLKGQLIGERRQVGRASGGMAYEQHLRVGDMILRRVTVELDEPTRDGDKEIHLLTNLPESKADAAKVSDIYRQRWEIENGFNVLTTALTCEVKSLGHPLAALFVFCTAMLAFNALRVLNTALVAVHGADAVAELSAYSQSLEIAKAADGMNVALTPDDWQKLLPKTARGRAAFLKMVAAHVDLKRHQKSHRGPKKKPPQRTGYKNGGHVSTAKIIGLIPN